MKTIKILFLFLFISSSLFAQTWKPVGFGLRHSTGSGQPQKLFADTVNNVLYAGGIFDSAGFVQAHKMAFWDGYSWHAMPVTPPIGPTAITVLNNEVYIGNAYSNKVYKWNGVSWTNLPQFNAGSGVECLEVIDGELYAGGTFFTSGSTQLYGISKWSGTSWLSLAGGFHYCPGCGANVYAIVKYQNQIAASGGFILAGGDTVNNIALWDGVSWTSLDKGLTSSSPLNADVFTLQVDGNRLYATGQFTKTAYGGITANGTAYWEASAWHPMSNGASYGSVPLVIPSIIYNQLFIARGNFFPGISYYNGVYIDTSWTHFDHITPLYETDFDIFNGELYMTFSGYATDSGDTQILYQIARLSLLNFQTTPSSCLVSGNGTATVLNVGVPPYTYLWSNGGTTQTITDLATGTYAVTMTDGSGSQSLGSVSIDGPIPVSITQSSINSSCYLCSDGSASINISGGTGINFLWNTGDTTNEITNQLPGVYTVSISDSSSCTRIDTVVISYFAHAGISTADVQCNGACNGTATATSDGAPPFTFLWNTTDTTQSINNLCAGNYSVVVTDSNGITAIDSVVINEPPAISTSLTQSICNGDTFDFHSQQLFATGNYSATLNAVNGCDSVVNLNLTVLNVSTNSLTENICSGDTYNFNGTNLSATGIYTDTLIAINSCDSIITLNLTVDTINASIQQSNDTLSVSSSGNIQWFDCNTQQIISGATQNLFVATASGNYAAIITEGNCSDTSSCVSVFTGVNELTVGNLQFAVFPNPVGDWLVVHSSEFVVNTIDITDLLGRKILHRDLNHEPRTTNYELDVRSLAHGIYFVRVSNEQWSAVKKIIKE